MKKSFFYLLVIVELLFSLSASAYDFKLDGVGYSIVSLSDLTCVVVECDELEVLSIPGEVFYKNKKLHVTGINSIGEAAKNSVITLKIGKGIEYIGRSSFSGCPNLKEVYIEAGQLTEISDYSFNNCPNLEKINFPEPLKTIGKYVFSDDKLLKEIRFPSTLRQIGIGAFSQKGTHTPLDLYVDSMIDYLIIEFGPGSILDSQVDDLMHANPLARGGKLYIDGIECPKEIIIPKGINSIYHTAFAFLHPTTVKLNNDLERIGIFSFIGCNVDTLIIPKSVNTIGQEAFKDSKISNLIIEDCKYPIKIIDDAFKNIVFDSIYFGRELSSYNSSFLIDKSTDTKKITIGSKIATVGNWFTKCQELVQVEILPSKKSIRFMNYTPSNDGHHENHFGFAKLRSFKSGRNIETGDQASLGIDDTFLEDVELTGYSNSTTAYYNYASECYIDNNTMENFRYFKNAKTVRLGKEINNLHGQFKNVNTITDLYIYSNNPPEDYENCGFTNYCYLNTTVHVPSGSLDKFQNADVWKNFWTIEEFYCPDNDENIVTDVDFSHKKMIMFEGNVKKNQLSYSPAEASEKTIEWTSSNENVAIVSSTGEITALSVGETIITAKGLYTYDKCRVEVIPNNTFAVDLALPSGKKWASMNLGAVSPEDPGEFYSFAELQPQEDYDEDSNRYFWKKDKKTYDFSKYNTDIESEFYDNKTLLEEEDNAAIELLGKEWQIPEIEDCEELIQNCSHSVEYLNGVLGLLFTGKNGNTIFIPYSGYKSENSLASYQHQFFIGTRNLAELSGYTRIMESDKYGILRLSPLSREMGISIRPIYAGEYNTGLQETYNNNDILKDYYSIDGIKHNSPTKGINIVRLSNGKIKKTYTK